MLVPLKNCSRCVFLREWFPRGHGVLPPLLPRPQLVLHHLGLHRSHGAAGEGERSHPQRVPEADGRQDTQGTPAGREGDAGDQVPDVPHAERWNAGQVRGKLGN